MGRGFRAVLCALLFSLTAHFASAFGATATVASPVTGISNFREMSSDIWRGGRPTDDGLRQLARLGVRTVLDLEDDDEAIAHERNLAELLGMRFVSEPMSGFWSPKQATVDAAEAALADADDYPIFMHCHHGQDRTGVVFALFRVFHENWKPADAYQEMLKLGFHQALVFLDHYFKEATHLDGD